VAARRATVARSAVRTRFSGRRGEPRRRSPAPPHPSRARGPRGL